MNDNQNIGLTNTNQSENNGNFNQPNQIAQNNIAELPTNQNTISVAENAPQESVSNTSVNISQDVNPVNIEQNSQAISNEELTTINSSQSNDGRKLKTASQMVWIFIGHYLLYGIFAYIIGEVISEINLPILLSLMVSIVIVIGFYYLTVKRIFKNNILYKDELSIFKQKVITLIIIFGIISIGLEVLPMFLLGGFELLSIGLFKGAFAINLIASIVGSLVIPLIAFPILINKLGEESTEVKQ